MFCLVSARQFRAQADQPGNLVHPASVLSLVHGREEYSLGEHVEILADPSRQLTITDVASPEWRDKFVPSRQQVPAIGYTDSAIWVRCQVLNPTAESAEWMVELGWRPRKVTFFRSSDNGAFVERLAGRHIPLSQWEIPNRFPSFRLSLPAHGNQTFYLQIISSGTNIHLPLRLYSVSVFAGRWRTDSLLWGIFFGILMFTTGYGFLMYFFLREKSYAYLAAMAGAYCFYRVTVDGWSSLYLWPHLVQPHLIARDLSLLAIYVFGILFSQAFLETRQRVPLLHRAMTVSILVYGLVSVVDLVFPVLGALFKPLEAALLLLMMAAGFIRWRQGYRAARFFLLAWIGFTVCRLIIVLAQVLLLTATWPARAQDFVWVVVVFLWAVALADRINLLKQERQEAISVLQNSEQKLRGIFDHAFQFIGLLKPDGTVVDANQAALDFAGVSIGRVSRSRRTLPRLARYRWVFLSLEPNRRLSMRATRLRQGMRAEVGELFKAVDTLLDLTPPKERQAVIDLQENVREYNQLFIDLAAAYSRRGLFDLSRADST